MCFVYYSRQFGFIKLNEPQHAKKKGIVLKAVRCLERIILLAANTTNTDAIYEGLDAFTDTANSVNSAININGGNNSNTNGVSVGNCGPLGMDSTTVTDNSSLLPNIKVEPHSADDNTALLLASTNAINNNNNSGNTTLPTSTLESFLDGGSSDTSSTTGSALAAIINNNNSNALNNNNNSPTNNNSLPASSNNNTSIASLLSAGLTGKGSSTLTNTPPHEDGALIGVTPVDPETYCKLGHFHLLLEDYPKGELLDFPVIYSYFHSFQYSW